MKKLLAAVSAVFLPSLVLAQSLETAEFETICVTQKQLHESLNLYREVPFMRGIAIRQIDDKKYYHPTIFFMNVEKKTWTVAEKIGADSYCIVSLGTKLEPLMQTTPQKSN